MHGGLTSFTDEQHRRKLGPNSLIFSFSSGASPAHNAGGRVSPLFSQQIFLMKEVDKRDGKMHDRRSLSAIVEG